MANITRNNHYVPQMYLKAWSNDRKLYQYDILVPHEQYPIWKQKSIEHVASMGNLLTRIETNIEFDDFENLFYSRFEQPAVIPLEKAISGGRMTAQDWHNLIRFAVSQYCRTPAFYLYSKDIVQRIFTNFFDSFGDKLNKVTREQIMERSVQPDRNKLIPLSVTTVNRDEKGHRKLYIESVAGKSMWLYTIDHLLNDASVYMQEMMKRRWSIITAAEEMTWPTNDNPFMIVDRLPNDYMWNFDGVHSAGCGFLLYPISPTKALISIPGKHFLPGRFIASPFFTRQIRDIIVHKAFMYLYSDRINDEVPKLRPRTVDLELFTKMKNQYQVWYQHYQEKEVPLLNKGARET